MMVQNASAQLEPQPTQFDQEQEPQPQPPTLTKPPELLQRVEPEYPAEAYQQGLEGEVILQIEIGADGVVQTATVVQSASADLDQAAIAAALKLVFAPAEWDGQPGPIIIEYRQVFRIEQQRKQVPATTAASQPLATELTTLPVNFEGVVREAGTKNALEGVEVSVKPQNRESQDQEPEVRLTYTDAEGRFFFPGIATGEQTIIFALTGYEPMQVVETFEADKLVQMKIHLQNRVTNKFETVVREKRAQKEVAKVSLTREEVSKIPGTFGDPLRVIENLPGLARAPMMGGALIVRGANPGDTGVYFDGVQIPLLYHFGGLKSIVNPEFLEQISFYPGGFGAKYGRATAGIVDVSSRELKMQQFHGSSDISVIDSGFFFGGPVQFSEDTPTVTIAAAARRSYIDLLMPVVLDAAAPEGSSIMASPVYWDYQLKAETSPWTGQRFSLFAFGSSDDIRVLGDIEDDALQLGLLQTFHRVVARHTSRLGDGFTNILQPFVGLDQTALEISAGQTNADGTFDTYNWGIREELQWQPLDQIQLTLGLDYLGNRSVTDFRIPVESAIEIGGFPRIYSRDSAEPREFSSTIFHHSTGLFIEGVLTPLPYLKIVPGMRVDLMQYTYSADDGVAADWGIIDGKPKEQVELWNTDPRLAIRLSPLKGTALKGAIGVYRQPPDSGQLTQDFGNPNLQQPRAVQYIAGFEHYLLPQIYLDVQLYTTQRDLLVQQTEQEIELGNEEIEPLRYDNGGLGHTVGAELMLRHEVHRYSLRWMGDLYREALPEFYPDFMNSIFSEVGVFGWVAYTMSRTEIDLDSTQDKYRLTSYDQTHILTVVAQANLPLGVTFGARFRLVTGNPTTIPIGSVHDLDLNQYRRLYSMADGRLPTFHQLDMRLDRKFVFDNFSVTPYLDLLNVYNQANAEGYFTDYRSTQQQPIPGLPILPNFGIKGEF